MIDKTIKTSAIQYKSIKGNVLQNTDNILALSAEAVHSGSQIIVFPEMCLTGYIWPDRKTICALAEKAGGASFQKISEFCKNNQSYLAYGFAEKDEDCLYNSQNLIGPDGKLLATYRKTHLYEMDETWALPGNTGFIAVDTPLGKLGLGICMDLNYDDFVDYHISNQTDIILFSTNWLEEDLDVHSYWVERFDGFKGAALMANTYGFEDNIEFCGRSAVYYNGEIIASAPRSGDKILI